MAAKVLVAHLMAVGMLLLFIGTSRAYDFYVGGRDGWVQNPSENFNHWAERNRFQVKDKLVFRYKKGEDSVLVVSEADYRACNTSNPIQRLDGGDSVFQFDRSGPFFFISGAPGRCQSGQKLIVVVLAVRAPKGASPPPTATPAPLPSPPTPSPLPSPPTAAPLPSPPPAAPTPSAIPSPTPSPSAAPTPSPSTAAPSPSNLQPSPSPSPSLSPAPSPSESVPSPSPAPTAAEVPASSGPTLGPSAEVASAPGPAPSESSYIGASFRKLALALALGFGTILAW